MNCEGLSPVAFSGEFIANWYYFLLKNLIEFASESHLDVGFSLLEVFNWKVKCF